MTRSNGNACNRKNWIRTKPVKGGRTYTCRLASVEVASGDPKYHHVHPARTSGTRLPTTTARPNSFRPYCQVASRTVSNRRPFSARKPIETPAQRLAATNLLPISPRKTRVYRKNINVVSIPPIELTGTAPTETITSAKRMESGAETRRRKTRKSVAKEDRSAA